MSRLKFIGTFEYFVSPPFGRENKNYGITSCSYMIAAEQKARTTYDNILRLSDDPDVNDVIRFLREREVVHYQRFGEAKRTGWNTQAGAADKMTGYPCP